MNGLVGRGAGLQYTPWGDTLIIPGLCFPAPWQSLITRRNTVRHGGVHCSVSQNCNCTGFLIMTAVHLQIALFFKKKKKHPAVER